MRVMRVNQESRNRHPEEFRGTLVIIYQATTTVNSVARIGSGSVEIRAGDMTLDRPATGELPSGNIHRHPQPTVGPSHQNSTYVSFPSSPGDTSPSVRDPWVHLLADHRQAGVWPARPAPCRRSVVAWILLAGPQRRSRAIAATADLAQEMCGRTLAVGPAPRELPAARRWAYSPGGPAIKPDCCSGQTVAGTRPWRQRRAASPNPRPSAEISREFRESAELPESTLPAVAAGCGPHSQPAWPPPPMEQTGTPPGPAPRLWCGSRGGDRC